MENNTDHLHVQYGPVWDRIDPEQRREVMAMGEDYKRFLNAGKTERLCTREIVRRAEAQGFTDLDRADSLKPGDKVYSVNRGKNVVLAVIGSAPVAAGLSIVGSHIDSPRLDLKQNPLYEDGGMALLKTHYYGGIHKYQWLARPLALYGVVVRGDGSTVEIDIGDDPGDPVFLISDLLPHLSDDYRKKPLAQAVTGEDLHAIAGTLPRGGDVREQVKQNVLQLLHEKYGIVEEDFISAELELVPAGEARDVGFDRGAVASYGNDDRSCAYASLDAILSARPGQKTAVALFMDKEEVGSVGATGMQSKYFTNTVGRMIQLQQGTCTGFDVDRALSRSGMLSADVAAAYDPKYASVSDPCNSAYLGRGTAIVKYTGHRGKSRASDASAEFLGEVRQVLNQAGVIWQTSEMGKVDQGGGGTIAYILANHDMDVLDVGVPVLAMHAPYEVISKADLYMAARAYRAFYESR